MRRILLVVTAAMVMALMMVAMALPVFAGGADDDEDNDNESANGGPTRNGQIVFRRYFDPDPGVISNVSSWSAFYLQTRVFSGVGDAGFEPATSAV